MSKRYPFAIVVIIAILAYWPIAFCIYTFKWDMLDVILPFRYFAGECIHNGVFPLWNPYLLTGVPVSADLQYPLWSPEVWLIGLTTGYSIYALHFLFIAYLVLAGYGMYRLTLHFNAHHTAALLSGIAYMLSGFFVGHGQALFSIVGAAYLPWVVLYMIKNCETPTLYRTVKLALFIFLMVSTGYQFISIITGYLLLAIFIYYLAVYWKKQDLLRRFFKYNRLLFILVILLCLVIIVPVFQASGYNERLGSGVRYVKSIVCSFTWPGLVSLFAPFATVKDPGFFNTDISMRNLHVGLIILLVFIAGLSRKKTGIQWLILVFGFVCLLASFGPALPLHKLMYRYLPLIHNLRMPAYFDLFFSFAVIVIAGVQLPGIFNLVQGYRKSLGLLSLLAAGSMFVLLGYAVFHVRHPLPYFSELFRHPDDFLRSLNFQEHILIQVPFQIVLLLCLFACLRRGKNLERILFVLVCCEMVVAVNLNSYFTVYSTFRPHDIQGFINTQPKGFPVPDQTAIVDNSDKILMHDPLWRNMGILTKKISYDGFSSFILRSFNYMDDSLPELRDELIKNPPVYLSGKVYRNGEVRFRHRHYSRGDLFLSDEVYQSLPVYLKRDTKKDTVRLVAFSPVQCTVQCTLDTAAVITYLQADYPGWKISIDGGKAPHFTSNFMYISALVPAGKHQVIFRYENRIVFIAFIISYSVFMALLCGLIYLAFWRT